MRHFLTAATLAIFVLAACQDSAKSSAPMHGAVKSAKASPKTNRCQKAPLYIAPRLTAGTAIAQFEARVVTSHGQALKKLATDQLEDGVDLLVDDVTLCDAPNINLPATRIQINGEKIACTTASASSASPSADRAVNLVVRTDAANHYSCQLEWMNG